MEMSVMPFVQSFGIYGNLHGGCTHRIDMQFLFELLVILFKGIGAWSKKDQSDSSESIINKIIFSKCWKINFYLWNGNKLGFSFRYFPQPGGGPGCFGVCVVSCLGLGDNRIAQWRNDAQVHRQHNLPRKIFERDLENRVSRQLTQLYFLLTLNLPAKGPLSHFILKKSV